MDKNTSEIAKLTERISRDPKSKLFVPLAEEYKKSGDIEMAIHVLTEGLKNNPGYVTARSFLGRLLFDMGDLASARREFEEVVKAVPENLLAQKKLGDLHVLLGNSTEALKYYKTARSLNPADAEIASLVSDLEAGVDVKQRLVPQKGAPVPEPRTVPQQKTVTPVRTETPVEAAAPAVRQEETGPKKDESEAPKAPLASAEKTIDTATGQNPPSAAVPESETALEEAAFAVTDQPTPSSAVSEESDEAEEVLVVEPLEEECPPREAGSPLEEQGLLSEIETLPTPAAVEEAAPPEEAPVVQSEPEAAVEPPGDISDDFTTDTLAELYIGQGFYEKAIDIYERMLADHPDSRGLRDKLERVRSLAASSEAQAPQAPGAGGETAAAETEATIFAEVPPYMPPAAADAADEEITLEADLIVEPEEALPDAAAASGLEDLFAESKEFKPTSPETEETAGTGDEKYFDAVMNPPAVEFTGTGTAPPAFEPREYIPPTAELRKGTEEKEPVGPIPPKVQRKEIIDRLENWLKTIKKEI
jgi:tetratricopeptide (TPR) repeat protein